MQQEKRPEVLRIGVVGAGVMGTDHAQNAHRSVSGTCTVAVADPDQARAEALADPLGARAYADGRELIASEEVDAVVIASADPTHHDLVAAALEARKPVLCEKPLAPTAAECRDLVLAEGRAGGGLVSVGFMRRFDPSLNELRDAVTSGRYGTALFVRCTSRGVQAGPGSTTRSALSNSAVHELDTVPWLLDSPIAEVSWQAPRSSSFAHGMQDPQLLSLRTADGTLVSFEMFLNARYGHDVRSEVVFEQGAVSTVEPLLTRVEHDGASTTTYGMDWRRRWAEAYRLELQGWSDSLRGLRPDPLATARDGLAAALVVEALVESQENGGVTTGVASAEDFLAQR